MSTQPLPQLPPPREPLFTNGRPTRRTLRILALTPPLVLVALLIGGGIGWAGGSWVKTHRINIEPAAAVADQADGSAGKQPRKDDTHAADSSDGPAEARDGVTRTAHDTQPDERKREEPTEEATAPATEEPAEQATDEPAEDAGEQPSEAPDAESTPAADDADSSSDRDATSDTSDDDAESSATTSGTQSGSDDGGSTSGGPQSDDGSADGESTAQN